MPRPKKHEDTAAKQAAYRSRQAGVENDARFLLRVIREQAEKGNPLAVHCLTHSADGIAPPAPLVTLGQWLQEQHRGV